MTDWRRSAPRKHSNNATLGASCPALPDATDSPRSTPDALRAHGHLFVVAEPQTTDAELFYRTIPDQTLASRVTSFTLIHPPGALLRYLSWVPGRQEDYLYDVFISYPRGGAVEPWVRKHLTPCLKMALQENLARKAVFIDTEGLDTGLSWPDALEAALCRSRVLLAVFSRQYFRKAWCLAELESMVQRHQLFGLRTPANPHILIHAIVAHDCDGEDRVPQHYRHIQRQEFKPYVYDYPDTDWAFFKGFHDSVAVLAEQIANTVEHVPPWRPDFPAVRPDEGPLVLPQVPRF